MKNTSELVNVLKSGGIAVMPTDTIYGLGGQALKRVVVERISNLKGKREQKPFIILIKSISDLELFEIKLSGKDKIILKKLWPGKVSVVLPCKSEKFSYLHFGMETLAFRLPEPDWLREVLKATGPLVSTSANLSEKAPAENLEQAKAYFGEKVDLYAGEGDLKSPPSTLISLKDGKIQVLRQGEVIIDKAI